MAEVPCSEKQTAGELDLDPDVELEVAVEEDPSVDRYSPHVDAEGKRAKTEAPQVELYSRQVACNSKEKTTACPLHPGLT
jgi:hypothetical protein